MKLVAFFVALLLVSGSLLAAQPAQSAADKAADAAAEALRVAATKHQGSQEFEHMQTVSGIFLSTEDEKAQKRPFPKVIGTITDSKTTYQIMVSEKVYDKLIAKDQKAASVMGRVVAKTSDSVPVFLVEQFSATLGGTDAPVVHRKRGSPL